MTIVDVASAMRGEKSHQHTYVMSHYRVVKAALNAVFDGVAEVSRQQIMELEVFWDKKEDRSWLNVDVATMMTDMLGRAPKALAR